MTTTSSPFYIKIRMEFIFIVDCFVMRGYNHWLRTGYGILGLSRIPYCNNVNQKDIYQRKKKGFWNKWKRLSHKKQGLDRNRTEFGRPK